MGTRLNSDKLYRSLYPADVQINGFAINIPVNEVSALESLLLKIYFLNKQKN